MANTGVKGQIIDENGVGLQGLTVVAYDHDVLFSDDVLGKTETDIQGRFSISYPSGKYGLEANPDIVVRVYDRAKMLLHETAREEDVTDTILILSPISILRIYAEGWLVFNTSKTLEFLSTGNSIKPLIDNEEAWDQLTAAIENAQRTIHILQLYINIPKKTDDPPSLITRFDQGKPDDPGNLNKTSPGSRLEEKLLDVSRSKNVAVRLLVNDFFLFDILDLPYPFDTAGRVTDYFKAANSPSNFQVRWFKMPLSTPMHAKVVIIDSKNAFFISSPLTQDYFDAPTHKIDESRRGEQGQIPVPIHDVSLNITGPAIDDLEKSFLLHWNEVRPVGESEVTVVVDPNIQPANISLQIVRTLRGEERFKAVPHGETGILQGYLRAIRNATQFIYLENQYFTCREIADALVLALKQKPDLQLIMLINNKVDIPFYGSLPIPILGSLFDGWQTNLIERLLGELKPEETDRIGLFTLWSHEPANPPSEPKPRIMRNYVHSKVGIVDDRWATVGSANLDGVSLQSSQHVALGNILLLGIPSLIHAIEQRGFDFSEHRSSEVNALVFNNIAGQPPTDAIAELRQSLWSEHLGMNKSELASIPPSGWLQLWKIKAEDKRKELSNSPSQILPSRILRFPYKDGSVPAFVEQSEAYLRSLGINTNQLAVKEEVRSFSFKKGTWT